MTGCYLTVEIHSAATIQEVAKETLQLAKTTGVDVHFKFNGTQMFVYAYDTTPEIVSRYFATRP